MLHYSNDKELLEAVRTGDEDAYAYLFRTYYPRLKNFAQKFLMDDEAAADIVQECYLRLWQRRETIITSSLQSFLYPMVRNSCLNELKHRMVVSGFEQHVMRQNSSIEALSSLDFMGRADSPMLFEELRQQIDEVLEQLPPRTHEVFIMSRFEGKKNAEIAEELGISTKVVEKHISKALRQFKKKIGVNYAHLLTLYFLYMSMCLTNYKYL